MKENELFKIPILLFDFVCLHRNFSKSIISINCFIWEILNKKKILFIKVFLEIIFIINILAKIPNKKFYYEKSVGFHSITNSF